MRQGLALVRGATIATALVAVPLAGPVLAHAVTLPGTSVDAGPVHVQTPPVSVPTPSVPHVSTPSVPHVPVPGPAGGAINNGIDRVNNTVAPQSSGGGSGHPRPTARRHRSRAALLRARTAGAAAAGQA